jgi:hypothetical protein
MSKRIGKRLVLKSHAQALSTLFHKYANVPVSAPARPVRAAIMWPSANSAGIIVPRLESPARGDTGIFPGLMSPLVGLRSMGYAPPTAVAVGQKMSALTGLDWQEYVTVFTNRST